MIDLDTRVLDPRRLAALRACALLDTPAEASYDRLTRLAAGFLRAPVSLVSLVDADRQWFKSAVGLPEPWATLRQTPLSHSFCRHVVGTGEALVVEDARADPRVRDNPAVPELGIQAYLGLPMTTADGYTLGSFCVIDTSPRPWEPGDIALMEDLTALVMTEIELRTALRQVSQLEGFLPLCCYCKKVRDGEDYWQALHAYVSARTRARFSHGICPECWESVVRPQLEEMGCPAEPYSPEGA
jgi:GAF domain-containing protein